MGHQVNFYAIPEDIVHIEQKIREIESLAILHSRSNTATPRIVPSLDFRESDQQWLFFHLVRESDLSCVVTRHVPSQSYWTIDVLRSPVIEFNRCYFDGRILRRGRVYYVDAFYGPDDAWMEKSEDFRLWAKSVLKIIRHCFKKHGSDYIGNETLGWLKGSDRKLIQ